MTHQRDLNTITKVLAGKRRSMHVSFSGKKRVVEIYDVICRWLYEEHCNPTDPTLTLWLHEHHYPTRIMSCTLPYKHAERGFRVYSKVQLIKALASIAFTTIQARVQQLFSDPQAQLDFTNCLSPSLQYLDAHTAARYNYDLGYNSL